MTSLTLNILNLFFVGMNIAIPHDFGARMAINAIQRVFAFGKLCDGLVIVVQAVSGLVGALCKCHCAQIVIAAVMADIALRI